MCGNGAGLFVSHYTHSVHCLVAYWGIHSLVLEWPTSRQCSRDTCCVQCIFAYVILLANHRLLGPSWAVSHHTAGFQQRARGISRPQETRGLLLGQTKYDTVSRRALRWRDAPFAHCIVGHGCFETWKLAHESPRGNWMENPFAVAESDRDG